MFASNARRLVGLLSVSVAFAVALPAAATASTPYNDTLFCWLIEYPPASNCDYDGWVGSADSGISPYAVPGTLQNTVVAFDSIDAIPSNFVVTSATFSAYQADELGSGTKEITVAPVVTPWNAGADWLSPWSTLGGDFGSPVGYIDSPGNGNWSDPIDITALVAGWVDGSIDNDGLGLTIDGADRDLDHAADFTDYVIEIDGYTR